MKFQDDLLTTLKTIKDDKNFDLATSSTILKGLKTMLDFSSSVDIQPFYLEESDFDKAIKLIKKNTSGDKREQAVYKWENYKKKFIEGNDTSSYLIRKFGYALEETLTHGKTWKRKSNLHNQIAEAFPHFQTFNNFFDLINSLIFPSVLKLLFEQSIQDFEKFDFTEVEKAIKSVQEEN